MTGGEWFELLGILIWIRNTKCCSDIDMVGEVDRLIKIINKEIFKTMTGKDK